MSTYHLEFVVLGDSGVGKTSLAQRFVFDSFDVPGYTTIGRYSFDCIPYWIEYVRNHEGEMPTVMLIGNKADLHWKCQVDQEEGKRLAHKNGFLFAETSAKMGSGVDEVFQKIAKCSTHTSWQTLLRASVQVQGRDSFEYIPMWLDLIRLHCGIATRIMVVGNKSDMPNVRRCVSNEKGEAFAETNGLLFAETSAQDNVGIEDVFVEVSQKV
ncbi:Importin subunit beta-1 [Mortierella antarctica]|nr:Importin subunit beta-1 [Mortierella antarctica]